MKIKRYHAESFSRFRKIALKDRGGELQREILDRTRNANGKDFCDWLAEKIDGGIEGEIEPNMPEIPPKITAAEFKNPTEKTSEYMWKAWKDIHPGTACNPAVWGYIVSRLIADGRIEPSYLMMGSNGGQTNGRKEIDTALAATGDDRKGKIDFCVRSFLRRLSSLPEARGARSVYQDCPPSRAWWQHYIASEVAKSIDGSDADIRALFEVRVIWELLSDKMATRLTVIGDRNIREGIVGFLLDQPSKSRFFEEKHLHRLLTEIGVMCSWRALGFFPPAQVKEIVDSLSKRVTADSDGYKQTEKS